MFIRLTNYDTKNTVLVNVQHIIRVERSSTHTMLTLTHDRLLGVQETPENVEAILLQCVTVI